MMRKAIYTIWEGDPTVFVEGECAYFLTNSGEWVPCDRHEVWAYGGLVSKQTFKEMVEDAPRPPLPEDVAYLV